MTKSLQELIETRRSIYALGQNSDLTTEELTKLIKKAIKDAPTAFNNQSDRAVFLYGESKDKFWDIVLERLRSEVPDEKAFEGTKAKIESFKKGIGTILFYTDMDVVKEYEDNNPLYAQHFYDWSEQNHGIATYAVWLLMTDLGLAGNIQHYNPIIDELVAKEFDIPNNWKLRSQFNFGSVEGGPNKVKTYIDDDIRFKEFN